MAFKQDFSTIVFVALRKESVDRNLEAVSMVRWTLVALRKESVDRNNISLDAVKDFL